MDVSHEILSVRMRKKDRKNSTALYFWSVFYTINHKNVSSKYLGDDRGAQGKSLTRPCGGGCYSTPSSHGYEIKLLFFFSLYLQKITVEPLPFWALNMQGELCLLVC